MDDGERRAAWKVAMQSWLAEKARKSASTRATYETAWHKFQALVAKDPWMVGRRDVVEFARVLQADGYGNGTVNSYVAAVGSFYAYVVDIHEPQLLTRNPVRGMDWLDTDDTPSAWIPKDHVEATLASISLDSIEGLRDLAILETLWRTALRNTAARSIRLTDFRRQGGAIWLRYRSKGKECRRLFPDAAWQRVKAYLEARGRLTDLERHLRGERIDGDLYLFVNHASNAHLWGDPERRPISREWLRDMTCKRTLAAVGAEYKPHAFRHGAARQLRMAGVDIKDIQSFLDHASLDMTARYIEMLMADGKDLADKL